MEDALVLAHKLQGGSDLSAALREYEVARIPRTAFITDLSWRMGRIAQIENPLLCGVRDVVFGAVPASVQRRQLERILHGTDF